MPMHAKATEVPQANAGCHARERHPRHHAAFGEFGLQSLDTHWVSARQIESARIACQHFSVKADLSSDPSPTSPSPRSPWRHEWVRVRRMLITGQHV